MKENCGICNIVVSREKQFFLVNPAMTMLVDNLSAPKYKLRNGESTTIPLALGAHSLMFSLGPRKTEIMFEVTEDMHITVTMNKVTGRIDVNGYKPDSAASTTITGDVLLNKEQSQGPDFSADFYEESPLYGFTSASVHALDAHGDAEKLRQLERLLPEFASFVESSFKADGDLPPVVPVRDSLPWLYARFGEWKKAENVIRLCISCGAYGSTEYRNSRDHKGHWVAAPEVGEGNLIFLQQCQKAAEAAIAYLAENPGTLQSKIYKIPALSEVDHDALVWFCRNSHQLRKEKDGKSNRLYVSEVSK